MNLKNFFSKVKPGRRGESGFRRERRLWIVLLTASLVVNVFAFASPALANRESSHRYQQILQYLLYYMQNLYVEPVSEERLLEGAVRGLLASADDPYTRFLNRDELKEFLSMEEGRRVGIGVEVSLQDGVPVVIAPIAGGPAEKAGIQPGDRILSVDGTKTEDVPFGKLVELITGRRGTIVELGIGRPGDPEDRGPRKIRITRDEFDLRYVRALYFEEEQIGYLRLYHFFGEESGSVEEFRSALQDFKRRGARGLVVDLRSNPGGHLRMAGTLTGYFLEAGQVIVRAKGRGEDLNTEIRAEGETGIARKDWPIVVLINEGSASASEIMAGALQDHGRAKLVGARSFGKASVQKVLRPLPGDTAALITIQKYFTPNNRAIHGKGLEPDIAVPSLRPDAKQRQVLFELEEEKFFDDFMKKHERFEPGLADLLRAEFERRGVEIDRALCTLILREQYGTYNPGGPDPDADPQLARALAEIQNAAR